MVTATALGLAWTATALLVRRREPLRATLPLAAGLLVASAATLVAALVPDAPVVTVVRGVGALWLVLALALLPPRPWVARAAIAIAASGALSVLLASVTPSWTSLLWLAAAFVVLHAARPLLVFPGLARTLAAAAVGSAAAWIIARFVADAPADATLHASLGAGIVALVVLEWLAPRLRGWPRPAVPPRAPPPGAVVADRYRVLRRLGAGSNGETLLAKDDLDGGSVALKWLPRAGTTDAALLAEARALGALRHPNVVRMRDAVSDPLHGAFLVMEHVDGGSLDARLARGPLSRAEFERVARGVVDGLAAVHEAGLVHQDIKPSNVLLTQRGEAKLADFGVARLPGIDATAGFEMTLRPVGTARYMSPEQARGRRGTARSDVWSAGATLFQAYTGRAYVDAAPGDGAEALMVRLAEGPGFHGSTGDARLDAFFARALEPDPFARLEDGAAMRDALAEAIAPLTRR